MLKDMPELNTRMVFFIEAFYTLNKGRQSGLNGANPLQLSEIRTYMDIYGVEDVDDRDFFLNAIQSMDWVYLQHVERRQAKERNKIETQKPRKRRRHRIR